MNPELWTTRPWLAALSLLPVPFGTLLLAWGFARGESFRRVGAPLVWLATRAVFAGLVWGALGHSGIDQQAYFLPQARLALSGLLPYRDFASAYAPLFAPWLGVVVRVFGDVGPLVLFLAADGVAWLALARGLSSAHPAVWAYAAWPPVWYFAVRYAQDEPLIAAFTALAWLAARRGRAATTGLLLGLMVVSTKPLAALLVTPFVLAPGLSTRRFVPALLAPIVLVYGAFARLGADVLQPLALEGASFGVGPTVWRVPTVLWGLDLGVWGWLPFASLSLVAGARLRAQGASVEQHAVWQFGLFAALAPKFMPMYVGMWAPLLVVALAEAKGVGRWWLLAYGLLLPFAWVLDSGPLQGLFGPALRVVAIAGLLVVALSAALAGPAATSGRRSSLA